MKDINYYDTFIQVAPDSPVEVSAIPTSNRKKTPAHIIAYKLLAENPYTMTQMEMLFEVHARHKAIPQETLDANRDVLWAQFFGKNMACFRANALPKKFGWGVHFDKAGKMKLVAMESAEYKQLANSNCKQLLAMRSSRKK
ncbi:MAG: DUF6157 family protein [Candidatus Promineifilaceae bacterium]